MKLSEFSTGCWFSTSSHLFKCTDVGSRTVIAVRIDHVELVTHDSATGAETRRIADLRESDQDWLNGPPYALAELVFDENDFPACVAVADPTGWKSDTGSGDFVTDGVHHWTVDDPAGPIGRARIAEAGDLIAVLEDEYSLPSWAGGPLGTSLEWNEVKRRLTGRDPLDEARRDRGESIHTCGSGDGAP